MMTISDSYALWGSLTRQLEALRACFFAADSLLEDKRNGEDGNAIDHEGKMWSERGGVLVLELGDNITGAALLAELWLVAPDARVLPYVAREIDPREGVYTERERYDIAVETSMGRWVGAYVGEASALAIIHHKTVAKEKKS